MLSIVTFADFGDRHNLKTADVSPVIQGFASKRERVQVFCRLATKHTPPYIKGMVPLWLHYVVTGLERISLGFFSARRFEETVCDWRASRALGDEDVILLHALDFHRTATAAKGKNIKIIGLATTAHLFYNRNLDKEELRRLGAGSFPRKRRSQERYLETLKNTDVLVCLSNFSAQTYIEHGFPQDRIRVAAIDVDTTRFKPETSRREDSDEFTVLFPAASIGILKGLQYLLDAWSTLDNPSKKLVILGMFMGWPEEVERLQREKIEKDPTIVLAGFSQKPEEYFKRADLVVFPSLTEGFGRCVAEAMAAAVPVITTPSARGLMEDGETGFIVPIRDTKALREKMEYLLHNPTERAKMGAAAREAVLRKTPFSDLVWSVYNNLLVEKV